MNTNCVACKGFCPSGTLDNGLCNDCNNNLRYASTLSIGDKITGDDGNTRTIKTIRNGFWPKSVIWDFAEGDWACVTETSLVVKADAVTHAN